MTTNMTTADSNHEEGSPPSTPLASQTATPTVSTINTHVAVSPPLESSLSQSSTDSSTSGFFLPIPTPSSNKSQSSFAFSDRSRSDSDSAIGPFDLDALSPDILNADLSLAADGSFVETSSGPAARELKRRYDQMHGVNVDVRSPYAITAVVSQYGKQMYRVGEMSAPAASEHASGSRLSQPGSMDDYLSPPTTSNTKTKRRSRMSVHTLLPPSLKSAMSTQSSLLNPNPTQETSDRPHQRNKLRKTRSIPETLNGSVYSDSTTNVSNPQPLSATGRAHSHSVTDADMKRPLPGDFAPQPRGDIFGDVMRWKNGGAAYSAASGSGSVRFGRGQMATYSGEGGRPVAIIMDPFGPQVSFDLPSRKPAAGFKFDSLVMPVHQLREVQSFESGLTARAGDSSQTRARAAESSGGTEGKLDDMPEGEEAETTPHASFIPVINEPEPAVELEPEPDFDLDLDSPGLGLYPLPETAMHSRYSTDVFDVLQTYSGLPLLDRMDDNTVIKISYKPSLESAAPRDDPRFVLWGETAASADGPDEMGSISQVSRAGTDLSASTQSSHASRRKSGKSGKASSLSAGGTDVPKVLVSKDEASRRILVAATIERWIAQLTSDLNYDELLNFFLTYRTYVSAVDLCHLLICRFHWALGKHGSSHDEMVRRIVRVRTFVAIRYWLLTFFNVDFLPNRELRLALAGWLNALIRDPILKAHNDGLSIVRKLIKVVKECREAHTRNKEKPSSPSKQAPKSTAGSKLRSTVSHVLGDKFAEATYKEEDSDVDLDFDEVETSPTTARGFQSDTLNARLSAAHDGTALVNASSKPGHVPSASAAILQQPLPSRIMAGSATTPNGSEMPFLHSPASLPIHRNTLSRAFVKTIGRLGNWKRVLNSRQAVQSPAGESADVSAFDLELNAEGDLLAVTGGVEQYLKMIDQPQVPVRVSTPTSPQGDDSTGDAKLSVSDTFVSDAPSSTVVGDGLPPDDPPAYDDGVSAQVAQSPRPTSETADDVASDNVKPPVRQVKKPRARSTGSSSSDSSFGSPIKPMVPLAATEPTTSERTRWGFDVVSIDDLDLSDTSSDIHEDGPALPPGLKKLPKKLPLRRDFEFVRRSRASVSSMGITSHRSILSQQSVASGGEAEPAGANGLFQQWEINAIVDSLSDNDESGDLEATLRRLEGQINPEHQQVKNQKVDGWVRDIERRRAAGDYSSEAPRYMSDEEGAEDGEPDIDDDNDDTGSVLWRGQTDIDPGNSVSQGPSSRNSQQSAIHSASPPQPVASSISGPTSPQRSEAKPLPEDVLPLEILQGRVPSRPSTRPSTSEGRSGGKSLSPSSQSRIAPRYHRSWILNYRVQALVEHFSMIDRELFMGVKFEELVLDDWMSCEEVNVLDWAQFLKDRTRWKAESRWNNKTSALAAVRGRFNLVSNFTISEIVLTSPSERAILVGKFIRIAMKSFRLGNYSTLVAIIAGLQSDWVGKAMRGSWTRLNSWETRAYDDLVAWTTPKEDFHHIRQAVKACVDAKPINVSSQTASIISNSATDGQSSKTKINPDVTSSPSGCIPFIGIYLSQLYKYSKLPDLIDPTAPNEAVWVDPVTSSFDSPAHPKVFSDLAPLPPSMQLEPLINVHKQRLIADVIKLLTAGQHLAARVQYPVDKKLFQRCLKIRGLETEILQRAQAMYE